VQTPQGFATGLLRAAHERAPREWDAADDGALVRALGRPVTLVPGEAENIKVTWPEDVARAESILAARGGQGAMPSRVGIGWDVHPLVAGRSFRLAGIEISAEFGPAGHSDGDPLAHAVADALLEAAALGDIGLLFPDTDPRCAGLAGTDLLQRTAGHLAAHGYRPAQVDAVLVVDAPRIAPHREAIRRALAAALDLPEDAVSVKGKRTEGLGGLAGGKGVACHAIASVTRNG
jgi:2-C-methyl-D-erythritol 2,4-cyclodiphosphate synthase